MKAKIQRYKNALKDLTSPSGYVPMLEENVVLQRTLASVCLEIERLKNPGGGENDE